MAGDAVKVGENFPKGFAANRIRMEMFALSSTFTKVGSGKAKRRRAISVLFVIVLGNVKHEFIYNDQFVY